jgi:hypothetical protein
MATNPAVLTSLTPGANIGGSSVAVPPLPGSVGSPSVGGNVNPFLPVPTGGTSVAPMTSTSAQPVTTLGATAGLGGANPNTLFGGSTLSFGSLENNLTKAGYPGGIASLIASFLQSGAGFNPKVAQALIDAIGPSIERGTENIMEQFSAMGNRFGSPAAVGLGDYMSQVNLNIGEIFAQMYETSVSDYLSILTGAKKSQQGNRFMNAFLPSLGAGAAGLITG